MIFSESSLWTRPLRLRKREKPLVLVTYNESIFGASDKKRRIWKKKGRSPLRPKRKGKEIMISEFLLPIGRLHVLDSVPNHQFLQDKNRSLGKNPNPHCYCTRLLEYGKNNYLDRDKMINQTVNLITRIFSPMHFPTIKFFLLLTILQFLFVL